MFVSRNKKLAKQGKICKEKDKNVEIIRALKGNANTMKRLFFFLSCSSILWNWKQNVKIMNKETLNSPDIQYWGNFLQLFVSFVGLNRKNRDTILHMKLCKLKEKMFCPKKCLILINCVRIKWVEPLFLPVLFSLSSAWMISLKLWHK